MLPCDICRDVISTDFQNINYPHTRHTTIFSGILYLSLFFWGAWGCYMLKLPRQWVSLSESFRLDWSPASSHPWCIPRCAQSAGRTTKWLWPRAGCARSTKESCPHSPWDLHLILHDHGIFAPDTSEPLHSAQFGFWLLGFRRSAYKFGHLCDQLVIFVSVGPGAQTLTLVISSYYITGRPEKFWTSHPENCLSTLWSGLMASSFFNFALDLGPEKKRHRSAVQQTCGSSAFSNCDLTFGGATR